MSGTPPCPIRDRSTGIVYESIHAAARATGMTRPGLRASKRFERLTPKPSSSNTARPVIHGSRRYASITAMARATGYQHRKIVDRIRSGVRLAGDYVVFDSDVARARLAGQLVARQPRKQVREVRRVELWEAIDYRAFAVA